jgi:hypothetical protein
MPASLEAEPCVYTRELRITIAIIGRIADRFAVIGDHFVCLRLATQDADRLGDEGSNVHASGWLIEQRS